MHDQETAQLIKETWLETFPDGYAQIRKILGGYSVILLTQNKWHNGIMQNDPLSYFMRVDGENAKEFKLYCLTRPEEGKNLVYETAAMRKQTIKKITKTKLIKRFSKVKEWLKSLDLKHEVNL